MKKQNVNSLWVWPPEGVLQHGKADGADELLVHLAHEPRLVVAHHESRVFRITIVVYSGSESPDSRDLQYNGWQYGSPYGTPHTAPQIRCEN